MFNNPIVIEKDWGLEIVIVNTPQYCGKLMIVNPGWQCSLHRHPKKDETFYLLFGSIRMEVSGAVQGMIQGNIVHIQPQVLHRFANLQPFPAMLIEFSTNHSDDDVERITKSQRAN